MTENSIQELCRKKKSRTTQSNDCYGGGFLEADTFPCSSGSEIEEEKDTSSVLREPFSFSSEGDDINSGYRARFVEGHPEFEPVNNILLCMVHNDPIIRPDLSFCQPDARSLLTPSTFEFFTAHALPLTNFITSIRLDGFNSSAAIKPPSQLGQALVTNSSVRRLELLRCVFAPEEITSLAGCLSVNATITRLDLSFGQVDDVGLEALAEAISDNASLTYLGLNNNEIRGAGVRRLAKSLESNSTLIKLGLADNPLEDVSALGPALAANSTLTYLALLLHRSALKDWLRACALIDR